MIPVADISDILAIEKFEHAGIGTVRDWGLTAIVLGHVPMEVLANGADKAKWEIEILGEMRAAKPQLEPLFNPKATRMRG